MISILLFLLSDCRKCAACKPDRELKQTRRPSIVFQRQPRYEFGAANREIWIGSPPKNEKQALLDAIMPKEAHPKVASAYFNTNANGSKLLHPQDA
jgi:hypothetical protein